MTPLCSLDTPCMHELGPSHRKAIGLDSATSTDTGTGGVLGHYFKFFLPEPGISLPFTFLILF